MMSVQKQDFFQTFATSSFTASIHHIEWDFLWLVLLHEVQVIHAFLIVMTYFFSCNIPDVHSREVMLSRFIPDECKPLNVLPQVVLLPNAKEGNI